MPNGLDVVLAADANEVLKLILYNTSRDLWTREGYVEAFRRYPGLLRQMVEYSYYKEDAATMV